jgi:hypothetical protein
MDLRPGVVGGSGIGPSSAIPGFNIDPPHVSIVNGKPQFAPDEGSEGVGGWISRIVTRSRGDGGSVRSGGSGSGQYKPVGQGDDDQA